MATARKRSVQPAIAAIEGVVACKISHYWTAEGSLTKYRVVGICGDQIVELTGRDANLDRAEEAAIRIAMTRKRSSLF